jgi:peptidoglycan/xylan/chitin deacetylase (PgdA/CDA1 family)
MGPTHLPPEPLLRGIRWLSRREPRVLLFHRFGPQDTRKIVSADTFDRQIGFLQERFRILPLAELVSRRRAGLPLPPNAVALTVDDSHEDFYQYAYPVLLRHGVPITSYVTTEFVAGRVWLLPDLIAHLLASTGRTELSLALGDSHQRWDLTGELGRLAAWSDVADHYLTLETGEAHRFIAELGRILDVEVPPTPTPEYRATSWDQVREMANHGVEIGSHTRTHPRLSLLSDESLWEEIEGSKRELEEQLSRPVVSFAYPYGTPLDFDDRCRRAVAAANYTSAVVGYYEPDVFGDELAIKRLPIDSNWREFLKSVYGVQHLKRSLGLRA